MSELWLTIAGIAILIIIAGLVQRWPQLGGVLVFVMALWLAVGLIVLIARDDFFRSSGLEADPSGGCGWAMVC